MSELENERNYLSSAGNSASAVLSRTGILDKSLDYAPDYAQNLPKTALQEGFDR